MIHPWTQLRRADGKVTDIRFLGVQEAICGAQGWRVKPTPVLSVGSSYGSQTVEILTSSGNRLTCTPDQKVAVIANTRKTWRSATSITPGQYLVGESEGNAHPDRVTVVIRDEKHNPTVFVSLVTRSGNAFFGGVLCACR